MADLNENNKPLDDQSAEVTPDDLGESGKKLIVKLRRELKSAERQLKRFKGLNPDEYELQTDVLAAQIDELKDQLESSTKALSKHKEVEAQLGKENATLKSGLLLLKAETAFNKFVSDKLNPRFASLAWQTGVPKGISKEQDDYKIGNQSYAEFVDNFLKAYPEAASVSNGSGMRSLIGRNGQKKVSVIDRDDTASFFDNLDGILDGSVQISD